MKVIITFTFCCNGKVSFWLWKSVENSEFFSPALWPPCKLLAYRSTWLVTHGSIVVAWQMYIEFCGGGAVDSIMQELEKPLTEPQIRCICHEICEGLDFLHQNFVIHRDLKAGNVLLTADGQVRLGDWFSHSYSPLGWLGSRVVSVLDSGAEVPGFKSQLRRCLRQTVHTHCASVD